MLVSVDRGAHGGTQLLAQTFATSCRTTVPPRHVSKSD